MATRTVKENRSSASHFDNTKFIVEAAEESPGPETAVRLGVALTYLDCWDSNDIALQLLTCSIPGQAVEYRVETVLWQEDGRVALVEKHIIRSLKRGVKLKFNEEAIATAQVFYHTFYSVMDQDDYEATLVVMAALSLASKVQEVSTVKLGDVVNTCHRCLHKSSPPLEVGDLYWQLKGSVARYELLLLRALKFQIQVQLPHPFLLHYMLALSRWVSEEVWQRSHVTVVAWALLQDSFHTTLSLHHPPHTIATAVLYLSMHCCKLDVPGGRFTQRQWWEVFSPGTSEQALQDIACKIMSVSDKSQDSGSN